MPLWEPDRKLVRASPPRAPRGISAPDGKTLASAAAAEDRPSGTSPPATAQAFDRAAAHAPSLFAPDGKLLATATSRGPSASSTCHRQPKHEIDMKSGSESIRWRSPPTARRWRVPAPGTRGRAAGHHHQSAEAGHDHGKEGSSCCSGTWPAGRSAPLSGLGDTQVGAFSPTPQLAAASRDGKICLWDAPPARSCSSSRPSDAHRRHLRVLAAIASRPTARR